MGFTFPILCFPTSFQNDETLGNLIWIRHCVIETHLPWWMAPKCKGLDGGREMIRCSYTLLVASFVFVIEWRWSRRWHGSTLAAARWMLHSFFFYKDCLGFGANLASLAPITISWHWLILSVECFVPTFGQKEKKSKAIAIKRRVGKKKEMSEDKMLSVLNIEKCLAG